ncbi:MAG: VWA domain-containing protein [Verrucomicrobiota bacterium]
MKTILALLATACLACADSPTAIIVLDASGSMWGQIEGKAKIEIARDVIEDLLADLPSDLELGLVAYGHRRKGDCEDIELLIPPGKVDRAKFQAVVDNILPKGMTPLTDAVQFAAEALNYKEEKASVILVTDGLETCDKDPCAVAKVLAQTGVDFTAHVVAFDLTAEDALTVECLATETGGQFLPAGDAASLSTALGMAVQEVVEPPKEDEPEPEIIENPVTLSAPESVPAGSKFKVSWEGEGTGLPNDFITIVPVGTEEGRWKNYAYAQEENPIELTAPIKPQSCEIRYVAGKSRNTLGRINIEVTEIAATVSAPEEAAVGSSVKVDWTGPGYPGDYITLVKEGTAEGKWETYSYARDGENPLEVKCPTNPGPYEIRYVTGQGGKTLARTTITLTEVGATLSAPETATAGSSVSIEWTGPGYQSDYITIVPKDYADNKWMKYVYTKDAELTIQVVAPAEPGPCEVRYIMGQSKEVMARIPIEIKEVTATVSGPDKVVAGSNVSVQWTGPGYAGDFITIVSKDTPEKKYAKYAYTKNAEETVQVLAPMDPGPAEIRYLLGQNRKTLVRVPISIEAAQVTLAAEASAEAGTNVKVTWTGPDNPGDFITIVPKNHPEKKYAKYAYSRSGSPADILAPEESGDYEIRYLAGQDRRTLFRVPIKVTPNTKEE